MRRSNWLAYFIFAMPLVSLAADADIERLQQMIERLEQRIDRLEAQSGIIEAADQKDRSEPAADLQNEIKLNRSAQIMTRYWLSQQSVFDPVESPLREGRMALTMPIKLKPQHYGYRSAGMFDQYKDPSVYPLAVLIINGTLQLPAGDYLLVAKPTPPREVGGAGNVQVAIELRIGGELVYQMPYSKSLASRQHPLTLPGGTQPVELRISARSPGFGPSPTGTEVYLGLQAEGEISPTPLSVYLQE